MAGQLRRPLPVGVPRIAAAAALALEELVNPGHDPLRRQSGLERWHGRHGRDRTNQAPVEPPLSAETRAAVLEQAKTRRPSRLSRPSHFDFTGHEPPPREFCAGTAACVLRRNRRVRPAPEPPRGLSAFYNPHTHVAPGAPSARENGPASYGHVADAPNVMSWMARKSSQLQALRRL